ncbi:MAG: hypothetical protein A3E78_04620 [Alphaproteobacteria bacterium RIFCSPHIGHO2_12_FULL_63_12]|nr:MAG: hypothetical protein A3E78_04620 [Alphaproteobacteria bacterium RIFCSPHIGHO2_12_FULL_63_12]
MRVDLKDRSAEAVVKLEFPALDGENDFEQAATEIYRRVRDGRKLLVFAGATASPDSAPDVATRLAAECEAVGIDAAILPGVGDDASPANFPQAVAIVTGRLAHNNNERPARAVATRKLKVAIAGLGLIGGGVARRLSRDNPDYSFCAAMVREPFKDRASIFADQVTNDLWAFLAAKPDVVVDALPDGTAGRALIEAAFGRGVSVVTANKQAIAGAMSDLTRLAAETGADFAYSASVGGGAPFIETVGRARTAGEVKSIEAVLNGTVNYILTSLAAGERFDDAVKAAQKAGFAEPDPSADLSGADARAKISILSYAAFGEEIDLSRIEVEALDAAKAARFASEGGCWKQLARLEKTAGGLTASVRFERRDDDPFFAAARWEANALRLRLLDGRAVECRGKGAGRRPTVESILGDLSAIGRRGEDARASQGVAREAVSA